jgi:hypothetical protein
MVWPWRAIKTIVFVETGGPGLVKCRVVERDGFRDSGHDMVSCSNASCAEYASILVSTKS